MLDDDRCKDCGKVRQDSTYCARSGRRHKGSRSPSPVDVRRDWIHPPGKSSPPRNRSRSTDSSMVWQDSVLATPVSKYSEPRSPASRAKLEFAKATESAKAALTTSFEEQLAAEADSESLKQSAAFSTAQADHATYEALLQIDAAQSESEAHADTLHTASPAQLLQLADEQYQRTEDAKEELERQKVEAEQAHAEALEAEQMRRNVEDEIRKAAAAKKKAEAAEAAAAAISKELEEVKAQKALLENSIAQSRAQRQGPLSPQVLQQELPASPVYAQHTGGVQTVPQVDSQAAAQPLPSDAQERAARAQIVQSPLPTSHLVAQARAAPVQAEAIEQARAPSLAALPASPTRLYTSPPVRNPPESAPKVPEFLIALPYTPHAVDTGSVRRNPSMSPPVGSRSLGVLSPAASPYRSTVLENTKERLASTLNNATDMSQELAASRTLALQALKEKDQEKETRLAAERQVQHAAGTLDTLRLANEELQKALHDTKKQLQDTEGSKHDRKRDVEDLQRSLLSLASERDTARAAASQAYNELSVYMRDAATEKESLRSVVTTLKGLTEERKTEGDAALIQSVIRQELSALQPTETEESLRKALLEERRARAAVEEKLQKQNPYTEEALRHALGEEKKGSEAFREALNKERELRIELEKQKADGEAAAAVASAAAQEREASLQGAAATEEQAKAAVASELANAESVIEDLQQKVTCLQDELTAKEVEPVEEPAEVPREPVDAQDPVDDGSARIAELSALLEAETQAREGAEREVQLLKADKTPETLRELKDILVTDKQQAQAASKALEELLGKEREIAEQQTQLAAEKAAREQAERELERTKHEKDAVLLAEKQLRISAQEELLKCRAATGGESVERLEVLAKSESTLRGALESEQLLRMQAEQELARTQLLVKSSDPCDAVAALTAAHEELVSQRAVIEGLQRTLQEEKQERHKAEEVSNSKGYVEEGLRRALSDEQRKRSAAEDELQQHRGFASLSHGEMLMQKKLEEVQQTRTVVEDENRKLQEELDVAKRFTDQLNTMIEAEKAAADERVNTATLALKKKEDELMKKDQGRKMLAQREVGLFREEHARLKALIEAKESDMSTEKTKIKTLQERLKECRLQNKRSGEEKKRLEQEFHGLEEQLATARAEFRRAKDTSVRAGEQRQKAEARAVKADNQEERILELQRELRTAKKQLRQARDHAEMAIRERDAAFEETSCVEGAMEQVQYTVQEEADKIKELQCNLHEAETAKGQADQDVMLLKRALIEANDAVNQSHMHLEAARREISTGPELRDRSVSVRQPSVRDRSVSVRQPSVRERSQRTERVGSQSVPFDSPSLSPSRGARGSIEVAFEDAVTGEFHVFNLSEWLAGAIQYTTNNEARPPTRRVAYDPVKGTLRLIDTGRHVTLPVHNRAEIVAGLRQLADQAGIPHNIATPQTNRSVSPAPPPQL